jgi:hypothetical protein
MDTLSQRKKSTDNPPGDAADADHKGPEAAMSGELISAGSQHLHRRLGGKEIQLFAVGGAIGTCMLISISNPDWRGEANAFIQPSMCRWERHSRKEDRLVCSWALFFMGQLYLRSINALVCRGLFGLRF